MSVDGGDQPPSDRLVKESEDDQTYDEELSDEEFYKIAVAAFDISRGFGGLEWAGEAWRALGRLGLTEWHTEIERARVVCRVLALAVLHREFRAVATGESTDGTLPFDVDEAVGAYPRIDPFVLGQLVERDGFDADIEVGHEFEEGPALVYALKSLVHGQAQTIAKTLVETWGAADMLANLYASFSEDTTYPLTDDAVSDLIDTYFDDNPDVWRWVIADMPVYWRGQ